MSKPVYVLNMIDMNLVIESIILNLILHEHIFHGHETEHFTQSATVAVGVHIYILAYSATLTSIPGLCIATSGVTVLFQHVILINTMILWWHFVFILLGVSVLVLGQTSPNPSALDLLPACGVRSNHALQNIECIQLKDRREAAWNSHFRCHRVHQTIRLVSAKMSNSRQSWVHVS